MSFKAPSRRLSALDAIFVAVGLLSVLISRASLTHPVLLGSRLAWILGWAIIFAGFLAVVAGQRGIPRRPTGISPTKYALLSFVVVGGAYLLALAFFGIPAILAK
ncbi:MAG: hypothetical protein M3256_00510 [Actinomycetota bacterium]|nr:hypothetical protein [Actinomycetota bacterium]